MNTAERDALAAFLDDAKESAAEDPAAEDSAAKDPTAKDPVEGALIVARIVDPQADSTWARDEIERLADGVASGAGAGATPAGVVASLAEHGFKGTKEAYYEIENSVLDHVLRTRRGIPISLGVVLMGVARRLGLDALGVNFPRHFLVTIGDVLVDPFRVAPTSIDACRRWLRENGVSEDNAFNVATPSDMVLRMLNNVRLILQQRGDYVRALEISDYQLMIAPDAYGLYVERADAWLNLEAPEMVVDELEKAAAHAPDESVAARLRERIDQARRLKSVVH